MPPSVANSNFEGVRQTPIRQSIPNSRTSFATNQRRSSSPVSSSTKPPSNLEDISHIENISSSTIFSNLTEKRSQNSKKRDEVLRGMIQQLLNKKPIEPGI